MKTIEELRKQAKDHLDHQQYQKAIPLLEQARAQVKKEKVEPADIQRLDMELGEAYKGALKHLNAADAYLRALRHTPLTMVNQEANCHLIKIGETLSQKCSIYNSKAIEIFMAVGLHWKKLYRQKIEADESSRSHYANTAIQAFLNAITIQEIKPLESTHMPYYYLGSLYLSKGDLFKAVKYFKEALKIRLYDDLTNHALQSVITQWQQSGQNDDILDVYIFLAENWLRLAKQEEAAREQRKLAQTGTKYEGNDITVANSFKRAADFADNALVYDPLNSRMLQLKEEALAKHQEYLEKAGVTSEDKPVPGSQSDLFQRGQALIAQIEEEPQGQDHTKARSDAIKLFEAALAAPEDGTRILSIQSALGIAYCKQGEPEKAVDHLIAVLQTKIDEAPSVQYLGEAAKSLEDADTAEKQALAAKAFVALGQYKIKQGKELSERYVNSAGTTDPGVIFLYAEAIADFEHALVIEPRNESALAGKTDGETLVATAVTTPSSPVPPQAEAHPDSSRTEQQGPVSRTDKKSAEEKTSSSDLLERLRLIVGMLTYMTLWAGVGGFIGVLGIGLAPLAPMMLLPVLGFGILGSAAGYGLLRLMFPRNTILNGALILGTCIAIALTVAFLALAINPFTLMGLATVGIAVGVAALGFLAFKGIQHYRASYGAESAPPIKVAAQNMGTDKTEVYFDYSKAKVTPKPPAIGPQQASQPPPTIGVPTSTNKGDSTPSTDSHTPKQ